MHPLSAPVPAPSSSFSGHHCSCNPCSSPRGENRPGACIRIGVACSRAGSMVRGVRAQTENLQYYPPSQALATGMHGPSRSPEPTGPKRWSWRSPWPSDRRRPEKGHSTSRLIADHHVVLVRIFHLSGRLPVAYHHGQRHDRNRCQITGNDGRRSYHST